MLLFTKSATKVTAVTFVVPYQCQCSLILDILPSEALKKVGHSRVYEFGFVKGQMEQIILNVDVEQILVWCGPYY